MFCAYYNSSNFVSINHMWVSFCKALSPLKLINEVHGLNRCVLSLNALFGFVLGRYYVSVNWLEQQYVLRFALVWKANFNSIYECCDHLSRFHYCSLPLSYEEPSALTTAQVCFNRSFLCLVLWCLTLIRGHLRRNAGAAFTSKACVTKSNHSIVCVWIHGSTRKWFGMYAPKKPIM